MSPTLPFDSSPGETNVTLQSLLEELDRASARDGLGLLSRLTSKEDPMSDNLHAVSDDMLRDELFPKGRSPTIRIPADLVACGKLLAKLVAKHDLEVWNELWWEQLPGTDSERALVAVCNYILSQGRNATFKELRRLKLCGREPKHPQVQPRPDEWKTTVTAWNYSYKGSYHEHLHDEILRMKTRTTAYYSNLLPIIQSSGTGKSRLAYEVSSI